MAIIKNMDHISVFIGYISSKTGKNRLRRIADIMDDGQFVVPSFDSKKPGMFENREAFNHLCGPDEVGYCGIWQWSVRENIADAEKDYYQMSFEPAYEPIRVFIIPDSVKKDKDQSIIDFRVC